MIIIYKITDYFPESNRIAVKFCREKSSKPIDDYNAVVINFEDIDTNDVESFSESLVNKSGLRRLDKHCLLYTSPSPRDGLLSRMPSSA